MSPPGCRRKSIIWNYFNKTKKDEATCSVCLKVLKYFGGTSNFKQHLLRIHPTIKLEEPPDTPELPPKSEPEEDHKSESPFEPQIQLTLLGDTNTNDLSESKIAEIDSKLLKIITKDYQPVSFVESEGFLEYSRELQPLYKPPNGKRLAGDILPKRYKEAASVLNSILSKINYCSITTDIWTSDSSRGYVTVTGHFIYEDTKHARVLATEEILVGSHTAEKIAEHLTKIFNDWSITDKIVAIVFDSATNVQKDINDCLHHPCIAHMLNLSVTDALSSIEKLGIIIKKCRALVGHFKHSVVASEKLKEVQQQMGLLTLKVKQDVATSWHSCFIMIDRLVQIKDALRVAVTDLQKTPEFLTADEWQMLEECIGALKPVNDLITALSSEKYPTISLIIPLIRGFQFRMKQVCTKTGVGEKLKTALLEAATRLGSFENNRIVAKACFLDPRFKKFGFGSEDNASNAQKWVSEELAQFFDNPALASEPMQIDPCNSKISDDIWSHFDKKVSEITTLSVPSTKVTLYIKQYLEMPPLERKKDPLQFWAKHKFIFPEMYELATKYLCIPATSVPSDRVFSKTGQLLDFKRNALAPENLNYIIFLSSQS